MTAKPDRRVQRTRTLLKNALLDLMLQKGYDAVTVQDIIDRANVGRSTFYAHFTDKDQLLLSGIEELRDSFPQHATRNPGPEGTVEGPLLGFSLPMLLHAQSNFRLYQALVTKGGGAMVANIGQRVLTTLVRDELAGQMPQGAASPIPLEVVVLYTVSAFMSILRWWLDNALPCSPQEVDSMFRTLILPGITALIQPARSEGTVAEGQTLL